MKIISKSAKQTIDFGLKLAKKAQGGQIYALIGDLGGGKTHFTKGLARGLGIKQVIQSPSFLLFKAYKVNKRSIKIFCHVDVYRLKHPQDIIEVGLKEYLDNKNAIIAIEWADKIKRFLSPYKKTVLTFKFIDKTTREITIKKSAVKKRGVAWL